MNTRRVNVRALIWRDGKVLAVKHKESDGSEAEYWATPGGGLDPGENLVDGVRREVFEELGVHATVGKLLFVQQFPSRREGFTEELEFIFHVEDDPQYDAIDFSATSHGAEELSRVEFIDPSKEFIKPDFLSQVEIGAYIQGDLPTYILDELPR